MRATFQSLMLAGVLAAVGSAEAGQAAGQPPPPAPAPQPGSSQPAPAQPAAAQPQPQPAYIYNPEGRRDPFLSLLGRGNDPKTTAVRPPGVPGLLIDEVTVKGVLRDRAGFIAMVQSPDSKTYIVRVGDKLLDGSVKAISPDKVVFSQDVNDPLSLVKQREKAKAVRSAEGRGGAPGQ